jgi:hypothetical protein
MDAAVAALLGTAVGAIGSIGGVWLQQRHQSRRDRTKLAADLGLADYTWHRDRTAERGGKLLPLSVYVAYHLDVLRALEEGTFNSAGVAEIGQRQRELLKAVTELHQAKNLAGGLRNPLAETER